MVTRRPQVRISLLIKAKREKTGLGVRAAAKAAGISAATFSRLERGTGTTLPDVMTLEKLARWIGVSLGKLLGQHDQPIGAEPEVSMPDFVEVHLRADDNLTPETASALATMFRTVYQQAAKKPKT
jgi:transcriptional regulator with XRE-family HTH domain